MLLVVFGAGASHDSVSKELNLRPYRELGEDNKPPLARDLFNDRSDYQNILNDFPAVKGLVPELRRRVRDDENIEEVLQSLYNSEIVRNKKAIAASRFYIRDLIRKTTENWYEKSDGMTNYDLLLNHIDDATKDNNESILLVTFNYDLMLEKALEKHGVEIKRIDDYIRNDKYKLIKLHGSTSWNQMIRFRTVTDNWKEELINSPETLEILKQEEYVIDDSGAIYRDNTEYTSFLPVIAIPMKDKNEFLCPESHLKILTDSLSEITHILTIGWRGTETHFTNLLTEHVLRGNIAIVAPDNNSSAEVTENLRQAGLETFGYSEYSEGFSGFVYKNLMPSFLNKV